MKRISVIFFLISYFGASYVTSACLLLSLMSKAIPTGIISHCHMFPYSINTDESQIELRTIQCFGASPMNSTLHSKFNG